MCCFGRCSISAKEFEQKMLEAAERVKSAKNDGKRIVECECCGGSYYKDEKGREITVD